MNNKAQESLVLTLPSKKVFSLGTYLDAKNLSLGAASGFNLYNVSPGFLKGKSLTVSKEEAIDFFHGIPLFEKKGDFEQFDNFKVNKALLDHQDKGVKKLLKTLKNDRSADKSNFIYYLEKQNDVVIIGCDEVGRGPLFGSVVGAAALIGRLRVSLFKEEKENPYYQLLNLGLPETKSKAFQAFLASYRDSKDFTEKQRDELYRLLELHTYSGNKNAPRGAHLSRGNKRDFPLSEYLNFAQQLGFELPDLEKTLLVHIVEESAATIDYDNILSSALLAMSKAVSRLIKEDLLARFLDEVNKFSTQSISKEAFYQQWQVLLEDKVRANLFASQQAQQEELDSFSQGLSYLQLKGNSGELSITNLEESDFINNNPKSFFDGSVLWETFNTTIEYFIDKYTQLGNNEKALFSNFSKAIVILIDGNQFLPYEGLDYFPQITVVKGDQRVKEISVASIFAKVHRDQVVSNMAYFEETIGEAYELASHKGYCSLKHKELLDKLGPTYFHRISFTPLKDQYQKTPEVKPYPLFYLKDDGYLRIQTIISPKDNCRYQKGDDELVNLWFEYDKKYFLIDFLYGLDELNPYNLTIGNSLTKETIAEKIKQTNPPHSLFNTPTWRPPLDIEAFKALKDSLAKRSFPKDKGGFTLSRAVDDYIFLAQYLRGEKYNISRS